MAASIGALTTRRRALARDPDSGAHRNGAIAAGSGRAMTRGEFFRPSKLPATTAPVRRTSPPRAALLAEYAVVRLITGRSEVQILSPQPSIKY